MKRHVLTPDRWVSVEDGTVRDLDGNELGRVARDIEAGGWVYQPLNCAWHAATAADKQAEAVVALLASPLCPTPGLNRYDRP